MTAPNGNDDPRDINQVTAFWNAARGGLVGTIQPRSYRRRVVLMTLSAPLSSILTIYRGYIPEPTGRITRITPASSRTYTAEGNDAPIVIRAGEACTFVWTDGAVSSTSPPASATVESKVF